MQRVEEETSAPRRPSVDAFYAGKCVLVTGGTGFVGKVVAEKLLRSCPSVSRVFLLVRPKKDKTPDERFEVFLQSSIFDHMRSERSDFVAYARSKFQVVTGDLMEPRLGLSDADWSMMTKSVNVILHNAATILFDEPLEDALRNNTMGALAVLDLAQECQNLASFVHCSTAYVNPALTVPEMIKEEIYPTREELTDDPEGLLEDLLATDPQVLAARLPQILGRFPNTYTFTKNLTEQVLQRRHGSTPVCIVRPSIVASTWDSPVRGWIDNLNAAGAYYLMGSLGLLRYVWGKANYVGDLIPVDFVANAAIVAAQYCAHDVSKVPVFHITSSHRNPIKWGKARDYMEAFTNNHPPPKALGPCDLHFMEHGWSYYPSYWVNQKLPALAYQAYANSPLGSAADRKNSQKLNSALEKSKIVAETFRFFVNTEWTYTTTRLMRMFQELSPEDQREFNFDPLTIDWNSYNRCMAWGLRYYVTDEKTLVHPDKERFSKLYFDRRSFQITNDILWAYRNHPGGITPSVAAPQTIVDKTLHSERVKNAILKLSAQHNVPVSALKAEASQILSQMAGQLYEPVIRTMAYFFRKIYKNLYDAIIVDELGLIRLRDARRSVQGRKVPLLVIPTHRSYIDFLMISFLFFTYELPMPQIAAGDDFLDMAGVNWIFRHSGAFFLKRSFRNDVLYRSIFEEYVQQLLLGGHTLEFFIEGTRSRTGKNLSPKMGLLNMASEPYYRGQLEDMHILPVTIGYEKMVEEDNHARQLTGEPRGSFSTKKLVNATYERVLGASFGRINIQFASPIVLSDHVNRYVEAKQEPGFDPRATRAHMLEVNRHLSYRVLYEFLKESVVMSTGIVAALVLAYRHGIDRDTLGEKYEWCEQQINLRGGRVDPVSREMDTTAIVSRALRLLGRDVVAERRSFVEPKVDSRDSHRNILQLGLYRNQLTHVFYAEALLLIALEASSSSAAPVCAKRLCDDAEFLSKLLIFEFNTAPHHDWMALLDEMEKRQLLVRSGDDCFSLAPTANNTAYFICSLVYPFIDTQWVAALSLFSLQGSRSIGEDLLVSQMQWFSEKLFFDHVIIHFDACSKESMRNAVHTFKTDAFEVLRKENDKLTLTAQFESEETVSALATRIGAFRKLPQLSLPMSGESASKRALARRYFGGHSKL